MKINFSKNSQHLCTFFPNKFNLNFHASYPRSLSFFKFNNLFIQLFYFIIISLFGYLGLMLSKPRASARPNLRNGNEIKELYEQVGLAKVLGFEIIDCSRFHDSFDRLPPVSSSLFPQFLQPSSREHVIADGTKRIQYLSQALLHVHQYLVSEVLFLPNKNVPRIPQIDFSR